MALKSIFLYTHVQSHYVIRTKHANNLQLTKCWKILHNANRFFKMFIDTGIPFDKSLVQLLELHQNFMLVQV